MLKMHFQRKSSARGRRDYSNYPPVTEASAGTGISIEYLDEPPFLKISWTGVTTSYHGDLIGRSDPDQHPIGAITGLQGELDGKVDDTDTNIYNDHIVLSILVL